MLTYKPWITSDETVPMRLDCLFLLRSRHFAVPYDEVGNTMNITTRCYG